jgi:hypothetical protein
MLWFLPAYKQYGIIGAIHSDKYGKAVMECNGTFQCMFSRRSPSICTRRKRSFMTCLLHLLIKQKTSLIPEETQRTLSWECASEDRLRPICEAQLYTTGSNLLPKTKSYSELDYRRQPLVQFKRQWITSSPHYPKCLQQPVQASRAFFHFYIPLAPIHTDFLYFMFCPSSYSSSLSDCLSSE